MKHLARILSEPSPCIVRATVRRSAPYDLPRPFVDATMGPFQQYSIGSLSLEDSEGVVGTVPYGVDSSIMERFLMPVLCADEPVSISARYDTMYWRVRNVGFRSRAVHTLAAVMLAILDIKARRAGMPLHRFLGAERDWAWAYGSGGSTALPTSELVADMTSFVARGFRCLKMKVGTDFGRDMNRDVARVRAVRDAIGPDVRLAIDANQTWSGEAALAFAHRVAEFDIAWFEEPVHSADLEALRIYGADAPIPAAMGESERSALAFPTIANCGCEHLQPTVGLPSLAEYAAVAELAHARGLAISTGGLSYLSCQIVACIQESAMTEILEPVVGTVARFLASGPTLANGRFTMPDTPGIAAQIDWQKVAAANLGHTEIHLNKNDVAGLKLAV